ncbi:Na+/H+ antiporter NhaA [Pseudomaricurvus alkylphenolicus]|jgi:NhaA family Na+:H+ antiporter|uniref:Na+/H+ antiporter NhaA n=1 Tax=Pseudomaricurvus alkylphenolicus TaxID=1306991 RepID=UPI0014213EB6|nr:Na+/H+ antiporter NhaA [Pseudomaricurvus alkylphenolicus]NIB39955.1 Na+/H+ antiporter NhaA [Pseudomaricurvus alkylphenolicus]
MFDEFKKFMNTESASGILLMIAAVLAMVAANTPLHIFYDALIEMPVAVRIGAFEIAKPLLLWINDGLMAVFFFLIGLELKRELLEGELSNLSAIVLPGVGAVGGMVAPALIYAYFNQGDATAMNGWAIPAATDIAFSLGILALLGSRVPLALKIFLVSLAIFDDIGAIVIIALFYTSDLSTSALIVAAGCIAVLAVMNKRHVTSFSPYLFVGMVMWVAVLKSGVHATLAGVILALFIPIKPAAGSSESPLKELEHDLHGVVAFGILPVFAFANAGVQMVGVSFDSFLHPVPVGIALGLLVGKQIGIFGLCWLSVVLGLVKLPNGLNFRSLYGVSLLCGVGFTMSLFIGSLAFEASGVNLLFDERLGILAGSLLSGVAGYLVLAMVLPKTSASSDGA